MSRERPILFGSAMVKAILEGRKVQTRRIVRPQPKPWALNDAFLDTGDGEPVTLSQLEELCPYGVPGDRLWCREAWKSEDYSCADEQQDDGHECGDHCEQTYVYYAATPRVGYRPKPDKARITYLDESTPLDANPFLASAPWRPSIHMPRWASRITLEVTEVRVQRLQEISEEDAQSEGVEPMSLTEEEIAAATSESFNDRLIRALGPGQFSHRFTFEMLWQEINGKRAPWASNPWVWAISFKRVA